VVRNRCLIMTDFSMVTTNFKKLYSETPHSLWPTYLPYSVMETRSPGCQHSPTLLNLDPSKLQQKFFAVMHPMCSQLRCSDPICLHQSVLASYAPILYSLVPAMKFIVTIFTSSLLISFSAAHSLRGHRTRSNRSTAHAIPSNVQTLFNTVKNGGCQKFVENNHNLGDGHGHSGFGFCTDFEDQGFIYLAGPGELGDMDVDCDGKESCPDDGDFQPGTAFDDTLSSNGYGISTLDARIHTYSVLGTCDVAIDKPSGGPVPALSTVAVVCNNQIFYSVFGDTNGCDDDNATGEASFALANLCFPGQGLGGNQGHSAHDILYIAFTNDSAVPGPKDADWTANDSTTFESSLAGFGGKLVSGITSNNKNSSKFERF